MNNIKDTFTATSFLQGCIFILLAVWAAPMFADEVYVLEQGLYNTESCANQKQSLLDLVMEDIQSRTATGAILTMDNQLHPIAELESMSSGGDLIPAEADAWNVARLADAVSEVRYSVITGRNVERVVIYMPHTYHPDINSLLSKLGNIQPVTVELRLVDSEQTGSSADDNPPADMQVGVSRLGCPATQSVHQEIIDDVIQQVASYLGLPVNHINTNTDLITDLGIEHADAFDVIAYLCEQYEVPLPRGEDLTGIREIARYLAETPAELPVETAGVITRGRGLKAEDPPYIQTVYFATDREQEALVNGVSFSGRRAQDGKVTYGMCKVSIPAERKRGQIERPFMGFEMLIPRSKQIKVERLIPLRRDAFWGDIKEREKKALQDVAVFIHGYNMSFDNAARRTAQLAFDTYFDGLPMMFSWPSNGSIFSYLPDREDVAWSVAHIVDYLTEIRQQMPDARLHLIAHSMGSVALIQALDIIALRNEGNDIKHHYFNVILAAPDFDAELFEQQVAPRVVSLSRNWTVYASDRDLALDVSAEINSTKRLGTPVTPVAGIDVVDASGLEVTPWSVPEFHSYYATKQIVIQDIIKTLHGVPANVRGLVKRTVGKLGYWQMESPKSLH